MKKMTVQRPFGQRGAALVVSLLMLVMMTVIGVSALQNTQLEEKMAGNHRDLNQAFQAAEAALRSGEWFLQGVDKAPGFGTGSGIFAVFTTATQPWPHSFDWNTFGTAPPPGRRIAGVYQQPKRVIEQFGFINDGSLTIGQTAGQTPRVLYRITARGTGGTDTATVVVQTVYAKRF